MAVNKLVSSNTLCPCHAVVVFPTPFHQKNHPSLITTQGNSQLCLLHKRKDSTRRLPASSFHSSHYCCQTGTFPSMNTASGTSSRQSPVHRQSMTILHFQAIHQSMCSSKMYWQVVLHIFFNQNLRLCLDVTPVATCSTTIFNIASNSFLEMLLVWQKTSSYSCSTPITTEQTGLTYVLLYMYVRFLFSFFRVCMFPGLIPSYIAAQVTQANENRPPSGRAHIQTCGYIMYYREHNTSLAVSTELRSTQAKDITNIS